MSKNDIKADQPSLMKNFTFNQDKESFSSIEEDQKAYNQKRRSSFEKKKRLMPKKKKYLDLFEEHMQTRYVLFYADEIIQKGIATKQEVVYHSIFENNSQDASQNLDENFKQTLRKEKGIFFDINVRPSSPRKNRELQGAVPFMIDESNVNYSLIYDTNTFGHDKESNASPTFKVDSSFENHSKIIEKRKKHDIDITKMLDGEKKIDSMLLDSENSSVSIESNQKTTIKKSQTQKNSLNDLIEVQDGANLYKMKRLSSFINNNYDSPNMKMIEQARRRREIDEIDQKYSKKRGVFIADINPPGEVKEVHESGVSKQDFRKSHLYQNEQDEGHSLHLALRKMSDQIDEISQDDLDGDTPIMDKDSIDSLDFRKKNTLNPILISFDKKAEIEQRSDAASKNLSDEKNQTREMILSGQMTHNAQLQNKTQEFLKEIYEFSATPEPKSGLLNPKSSFNKKNSQLQFLGSSKHLINQKNKGLLKQDSNSDFNSMKSESGSSEQESSNSDGQDSSEAIRIRRLKSIWTNKQSIATKKLERQHQMMQDQIAQSSLGDSGEKKGSWLILPFQPPYALVNKSQLIDRPNLFNARTSILSMKKLETDQPYKSGRLDPLVVQQSSSKQKTSHRKDINLSVKKSKQTGERSLMANLSSQVPLSQAQKLKKRQRRKEIKELKKMLTKEEKEEEDENLFIKNQEKALMKLKKICETLKGFKITENCYDGEDIKTEIDGSKSEMTQNVPQTEVTPFNGTIQRSNGSTHQVVSISTPQQTQNQASSNSNNQQINRGSDLNSIQQSRMTKISQCRSEKQVNEFCNLTHNKKSSSNDNQFLGGNNTAEAKPGRQSSGMRQRADTLSISGFNNRKFDLHVEEMNFSQRSKTPRSSLESIVNDLISSQSKKAQNFKKESSKKLTKTKSLVQENQPLDQKGQTALSKYINTQSRNQSIQAINLTQSQGHQNIFMNQRTSNGLQKHLVIETTNNRPSNQSKTVTSNADESDSMNDRVSIDSQILFPQRQPSASVPLIIPDQTRIQLQVCEQKMEVEDENNQNEEKKESSQIDPLPEPLTAGVLSERNQTKKIISPENKNADNPQQVMFRHPRNSRLKEEKNLQIKTKDQSRNPYDQLTSESEFSFKKSPTNLRTNLDSAIPQQFEMSLTQLETFSFKKGESPTIQRVRSPSSLSKGSLTRLHIIESKINEGQTISSSNISGSKKYYNRNDYLGSLSLNLKSCLKDIDRDVGRKLNIQKQLSIEKTPTNTTVLDQKKKNQVKRPQTTKYEQLYNQTLKNQKKINLDVSQSSINQQNGYKSGQTQDIYRGQNEFFEDVQLIRDQNNRSLQNKYKQEMKQKYETDKQRIRKIEIQLSKQSRSNETILFPNKESIQTPQSPYSPPSQDNIPKDNIFSEISGSEMAGQNSRSNHAKNRVSLGGMVFGLQVQQFSESPARIQKEKSEQIRKYLKNETIEEDLDELQSMFSRHHIKSTKKNQLKGMKPQDCLSSYPSEIGRQSVSGGVTTFMNQNKIIKSAYTGYIHHTRIKSNNMELSCLIANTRLLVAKSRVQIVTKCTTSTIMATTSQFTMALRVIWQRTSVQTPSKIETKEHEWALCLQMNRGRVMCRELMVHQGFKGCRRQRRSSTQVFQSPTSKEWATPTTSAKSTQSKDNRQKQGSKR